MVRFINEIILKYLLGISKCTKLPGKKQTNKQTKTLSQNKYKFTYWTYLQIGNILSKTFSLFFYYLFLFLRKRKKKNSSVLNSTAVNVLVQY